jgi:uncharacterized protein (UPF0335 family)
MALQDIGNIVKRIEFLMEEQKMLLDDIKDKLNGKEFNVTESFSSLPIEDSDDVEYYEPDGWN